MTVQWGLRINRSAVRNWRVEGLKVECLDKRALVRTKRGDIMFKKDLKKEVKEKGSIEIQLSKKVSASLLLKASDDFELALRDEQLGDVIWLQEEEIFKLEEVLSMRKEIRDRQESR